ncbi:hypothetical protein [Streptomyces sp. NPDC003032]
MNIVASIYARTVRTYAGTTYDADTRSLRDVTKAEYVPGALIGFVIERGGLFFFTDDEQRKVYGEGEFVAAPALKVRTRATMAARRHFGRDIVVL